MACQSEAARAGDSFDGDGMARVARWHGATSPAERLRYRLDRMRGSHHRAVWRFRLWQLHFLNAPAIRTKS